MHYSEIIFINYTIPSPSYHTRHSVKYYLQMRRNLLLKSRRYNRVIVNIDRFSHRLFHFIGPLDYFSLCSTTLNCKKPQYLGFKLTLMANETSPRLSCSQFSPAPKLRICRSRRWSGICHL